MARCRRKSRCKKREKARRNAACLLQNPERNFARIRLISSSFNTGIVSNVECTAEREETEMKRGKVTVYFNKTFFISGMTWSLCCISPWIVFLYFQTDGFREVILDEGFFVLAVFLLLAISLPIILV